jgi:hypothetical protein
MARPSVFISSTSEDLRAYRAAARDAALRAGFFPVMMEYWTAAANAPLDVCLGRVDEAELLVAIVAHRYGWKPPDQPAGDVRKSITWLECERAVGRPADVLAFPLDDKVAWPGELREEYRFTDLGVKGQLTPERVVEVQADIAALGQFKTWLGTGRVFGAGLGSIIPGAAAFRTATSTTPRTVT